MQSVNLSLSLILKIVRFTLCERKCSFTVLTLKNLDLGRLKTALSLMLLFAFSSCVSAIDTYEISVDLAEHRSDGKDWDSLNIGEYKKPEIKIEVNNQVAFRCRNQFSCVGEFLSTDSDFRVKISEFDSVNKNETIGEEYCPLDTQCEIGLASVIITKNIDHNDFGNCSESVSMVLAKQQVIRNVNKFGEIKSYSYVVKNCNYTKENSYLEMTIETRFVGRYYKYIHFSEGTLIVSESGSEHEYIETKANKALGELKIIKSIKDFIIDKDTNVIVVPKNKT